MQPTTSHFRIIEVLGAGGFGKVYRAESGGPGVLPRQVALKVLHNGLPRADEMASRFRDEARILARLSHRAIVKVDTLIRLEGQWCVVMEYLEGADLKTVVQGAGALPASAALEIVAEVAGALHAAYTAEVDGRPLRLIHRDIKPSNIVITAAGEAKLLDFGVARAEFEDREAQTRSMSYGTIEYMAPESMLVEANPKGDVYGLGAILAELLLGQSIGRASPSERRHQARIDGVAREVEGVTGVPELGALVAGLLAYEPEDRPDAREVQRRCLQALRGAPGEPLREWAEREVHRLREAREVLTDALCGTAPEEVGRDADGVARFVAPHAAAAPGAGAHAGAASSTRVETPARGSGAAGRADPDPFVTAPRAKGVGMWALAGAGLAAAFAVVVAAGGFVAWRWMGAASVESADAVASPPSTPAAVEPAAPAAVEKPVVPVAPEKSVTPTAKPVVREPTADSAASKVVPKVEESKPVEPNETNAAVEATADGEIEIDGDEQAVVLRGPNGIVRPGHVAPGQYSASVKSAGGVLSEPVSIPVAAGQRRLVRCREGMGKCRLVR